jgi:hypothetical protein
MAGASRIGPSSIAVAIPAPLVWRPMRTVPMSGRPLVLRTGHPANVGKLSTLYGGWIAPTKNGAPPDFISPSGWMPLPTEWQPMKTAPRNGRAIILRDGPDGAMVGRSVDSTGWDTLPNAGGFTEWLRPTGWAPLPEDEEAARDAA